MGDGLVVVARSRPGGGAVPHRSGRDPLAGGQSGGMTELRGVADLGADVEHRVLADERPGADAHGCELDRPAVSAVPVEERLLADHRARADLQQVRGDRDVAGEDQCPPADPGAECPQVQPVQRCALEQAEDRV